MRQHAGRCVSRKSQHQHCDSSAGVILDRFITEKTSEDAPCGLAHKVDADCRRYQNQRQRHRKITRKLAAHHRKGHKPKEHPEQQQKPRFAKTLAEQQRQPD
jgi:hypothetical protein